MKCPSPHAQWGRALDVLGWLLVKPNHISRRIAKSSRDLRGISADGLHDLAAVGYCVLGPVVR
jgi:hypothetical protein